MDDSQWKNMRVKLTPTFTSGKMKMMFHSVVTHSKTLIQAFDKCVKDNKDIDSLDVSMQIIQYNLHNLFVFIQNNICVQ